MSDCILFEHFVQLLHSISQVHPRRANSSISANGALETLELVDRWFIHLRQSYSPIPPNTCLILFRLLFPEEDVRRKYNLKETTLARCLATDVFGLSTTGMHGAGRSLTHWSKYPDTHERGKTGCLGIEVEQVLSARHSRQSHSSSIQRIDSLLDELGSLSGYSNLGISVRHVKRPRAIILRDLFLNLDPIEAKFLTQIILKDLRPALYPLTETHTTRALLHYKSNAVHILTKWEVMKAWHPSMPRVYRARATLDEAARAIEALPFINRTTRDQEVFSPILGVPIEIPKAQKGVKLSHTLGFFREQYQNDVWAETKYDGERMQIHIDLTRPASSQIKIFSKSKRDSTLDRRGTHPIIRAALGLPPLPDDNLRYPKLRCHANTSPTCSVLTSVVLEAEMVCYSESKDDIDEFWRIRSLIESTAYGVRGSKFRNTTPESDSQRSRESILEESPGIITESLQSNASDRGDRHLKLVFFDVLVLEGVSLLDQEYVVRRKQLESLVNQIPGYVSLSARTRIDLACGLPSAVKMLAKVFSEHIANHQEGIVLKAPRSRYNDRRLPWVKLKRDYIPGYGDTVDLVIIGAGWNKERARELRVAPETFTTFFVAAQENPTPGSDLAYNAPRFQFLFIVEYGMDREQLETFNMYIKSSDILPFRDNMSSLPYIFKLPEHGSKPAFMFSRPLLGELFGAGFTKDTGMKYYSLRFPRLTKVWWTNERTWAEGSDLEEYQSIARSSIGHESSEEWASRTVEAMWGSDVDLGPKDPRNIAQTSGRWYQKLLESETSGSVGRVGAMFGDSKRVDSCPSKRKAPRSGTTSSPRKRRKLETQGTPKQGLRALGSMTNFMHMDDAAAAQGHARPDAIPNSSPAASHIHVRGDGFPRVGQIENRTSKQVAHNTSSVLQREPIAPVKILDLITPPRALDTCPISDVSQPPTSADLGREFEVIPVEQPARSDISITTIPLTFRPTSSSRIEEEEPAPARFHKPYWPQKYIHTPIVQFLQEAYVWIPRDLNNKRPADRPPARELVPRHRRIGLIYCALIICGCKIGHMKRDVKHFAHVDKCVVFVETGHKPEIQEGLNWLLSHLEGFKGELNNQGKKELFVFDSNMISYGMLSSFCGDVASQALWRSNPRIGGQGATGYSRE